MDLLSNYEGLLLHKDGLHIVLAVPADGSMLMEECHSIVAMNCANSDELEAMGKQIYKTFKHIVVTDVTIMKPNSIKQYVLEESARLEQLQAVFEDLNSLSCSPLPPPMTNWGSQKGSEEQQNDRQQDAIFSETYQAVSQDGLRRSAMLHQEDMSAKDP